MIHNNSVSKGDDFYINWFETSRVPTCIFFWLPQNHISHTVLEQELGCVLLLIISILFFFKIEIYLI